MSQALIPVAFLAGVATLAVSVPALTEPPGHAPAHGARDAAEGYAPQYHQRHDEAEFRYYENACSAGGEAALGAVLGSFLGEAQIGAQLGEALTDCDRSQFETAAQIAFDNNAPAYWRNPQTGSRGVVHAGAPMDGYAHECRRAEAEFYTRSGEYEHETVTLCRDGEGGWTPAR
ncbi:MAG: RT0821/Lpp0805 family surface protein [Oceanicaulis sp.]